MPYHVRDVDWWGPVGTQPPGRMWLPWRGLDIPGPRPTSVVSWCVEPWCDGSTYIMREGTYRGKALGTVPLPFLRALVRERPVTPGALHDYQAARLLLYAIGR